MRTIAVLGSGSWGTALAVHLARQDHQVRLWGRDARLVDEMRVRKANAVYLPDVTIPKGVAVTSDLRDALDSAEFVVSAVPCASPPCSAGAGRLQAAHATSRQRLTPATRPQTIPAIQTQRRQCRRRQRADVSISFQRTGMSKWWTSSRVPSDV